MVALSLVVMVFGLVRMERSADLSGSVTAASTFGLAILSKLYPIWLSPALLLFLLRQKV